VALGGSIAGIPAGLRPADRDGFADHKGKGEIWSSLTVN
jgi:hypothetical protein